ncbi:MFS transporter, MHS family, alpha-ketoglutarate permease [Rhodoblastus acidophilus]|uniref:MFS transporter, MHS family, alpha-ketoglutarate permease n=1 Tax=Rhodoblastus acidophilus TaxID=1074 RepID=A0A212PW84_RHOAC|nr:MFS transporter [Rhodoblastus acidophilus]SNB51258.1 MFS transporter, MHS family, alpha-ketoglutarate permease [Rhodoblastus acidophilus]
MVATEAARPQTQSDRKYRMRLQSIFRGSIGNLVEYFDWYVYSAFLLYFAPKFFPSGDTTAQLMNGAAIFAVGFLVRPLGGYLLGSYADRKGRRAALMLSVWLMCGGSLVIACTPTYETIGVAAPIVLLLARLLQGISLGGEYGSSATYLSEMATPGRRGFYSSFQYVTIIMGQLLALLILVTLQRVLLTPAQLDAWGWRIPFFVGALIAAGAIWLRRGMAETDSFTDHTSSSPKRSNIRELARHPREVGVVLALTAGGTVSFYTFTTYMQKYLVNTTGFSKDDATLISTFALLFFMVIQPLAGMLSDFIGRRAMLIGFGALGATCTVPLLTALAEKQSFGSALIWYGCALLITTGYTSINAIFKAELFPVHIRALGVGFPFAVGVSLFGGTAEYLALWLKSIGHEVWFYYYVSACAGLSLIVSLFMKDPMAVSKIEK